MKLKEILLVLFVIIVTAVLVVFNIRYTDAKADETKLELVEKIDSLRCEFNDVKTKLDSLSITATSDRRNFNREIAGMKSELKEMGDRLEEFDKDLYAFD